jgi:hypothetical protein
MPALPHGLSQTNPAARQSVVERFELATAYLPAQLGLAAGRVPSLLR